MKLIYKILSTICITLALGFGATGCIEDGISTSASDQPVFSTDTLRMGSVFTLDATPTHRFVVFNNNDKGIMISDIRFSDDPSGIFRLNVDGIAGKRFNNVEIRANDSIFVFVEATLPENGRNQMVDVVSHLEFVTNGVTRTLPVKISGRDVTRLRGDARISSDTSFSPEKPYQIYDSLVVEKGVTLTLPAGTELFMHDAARIKVYGTLRMEGTAEKPVSITGDRSGYVAASIPYEIMSGQWGGIEFAPESRDNFISHATIRNSEWGLIVDGADNSLRLINSQIRNTKEYVLRAFHSNVDAAGCEFADASLGLVGLIGGSHSFNHCTFANYYLFTAIGGPALQFAHYDDESLDLDFPDMPLLSARLTNCILYGIGGELSKGDLEGTDIYLQRCLLKSAGSDDDHFIDCIWDKDPKYYTEREQYKFDYRLRDDSPARDAADMGLTDPATASDRYGLQRAGALGAYESRP